MKPEMRSWWCIKIRPFFKWVDLWIGVYVDVEGQALYICPIPMIGIKIMWWKETIDDLSFYDGWNQAIGYIETVMRLENGDYNKALEMTKAITER